MVFRMKVNEINLALEMFQCQSCHQVFQIAQDAVTDASKKDAKHEGPCAADLVITKHGNQYRV